jgi:hypothetical protein
LEHHCTTVFPNPLPTANAFALTTLLSLQMHSEFRSHKR